MDAGTGRQDSGRLCVRLTERKRNQPSAETVGEGCGHQQAISYHTSRHTFATMMLTLGADLYTTSKLLGHADVKMTQVYAKIVNKKKTRRSTW